MPAAATRSTGAAAAPPDPLAPELEEIYQAHFDFVWRSARRLGVSAGAADDVVQEVFLIVHRQLAGFEGRSSIKTWLFGILHHVVKRQRRSLFRRGRQESLEAARLPASQATPHDQAVETEARRMLHELLDQLDGDKRAVFVLAELEQMSAPEIAEATGLKLNTVYSRLRLARAELERALRRQRARDRGDQP